MRGQDYHGDEPWIEDPDTGAQICPECICAECGRRQYDTERLECGKAVRFCTGCAAAWDELAADEAEWERQRELHRPTGTVCQLTQSEAIATGKLAGFKELPDVKYWGYRND